MLYCKKLTPQMLLIAEDFTNPFTPIGKADITVHVRTKDRNIFYPENRAYITITDRIKFILEIREGKATPCFLPTIKKLIDTLT